MKFPWTPREDELLIDLWTKDWSANRISQKMRRRTRNAIIGRVHRLELPKRKSPIKRTYREKICANPNCKTAIPIFYHSRYGAYCSSDCYPVEKKIDAVKCGLHECETMIPRVKGCRFCSDVCRSRWFSDLGRIGHGQQWAVKLKPSSTEKCHTYGCQFLGLHPLKHCYQHVQQ